jgi:hypothetical protein
LTKISYVLKNKATPPSDLKGSSMKKLWRWARLHPYWAALITLASLVPALVALGVILAICVIGLIVSGICELFRPRERPNPYANYVGGGLDYPNSGHCCDHTHD